MFGEWERGVGLDPTVDWVAIVVIVYFEQSGRAHTVICTERYYGDGEFPGWKNVTKNLTVVAQSVIASSY